MDRENLIDALALIAWNSEPKNAQTITKAITVLNEQAQRIADLMKKQEAVKPINAFKRVNGTTAYSCPRCAALIVDGNYCKHCGQAVKWDGTFQIQY